MPRFFFVSTCPATQAAKGFPHHILLTPSDWAISSSLGSESPGLKDFSSEIPRTGSPPHPPSLLDDGPKVLFSHCSAWVAIMNFFKYRLNVGQIVPVDEFRYLA